jgi:hypothetical protein
MIFECYVKEFKLLGVRWLDRQEAKNKDERPKTADGRPYLEKSENGKIEKWGEGHYFSI